MVASQGVFRNHSLLISMTHNRRHSAALLAIGLKLVVRQQVSKLSVQELYSGFVYQQPPLRLPGDQNSNPPFCYGLCEYLKLIVECRSNLVSDNLTYALPGLQRET
jgi:hypothetical protein